MPDGERRLAAIMFTDMVGCTALTQSNESQVMGVLDGFFECMFRSAADHTLPATDLSYKPLVAKARSDVRFAEIF